MEERFVKRKKCKRGQVKTKIRSKTKTKNTNTKDVVIIKSMEGRKKKEKVATSNWKEIGDIDNVNLDKIKRKNRRESACRRTKLGKVHERGGRCGRDVDRFHQSSASRQKIPTGPSYPFWLSGCNDGTVLVL